jgi:hypothetical protein
MKQVRRSINEKPELFLYENGKIKLNRRFKQTWSHLSSIDFLSPAPSRMTVSSLEIVI